ncbi:alginate O-acetyltransferase AlgX-related protein [Zhengella sp. ZM62]|uniref:alginate O-acetyltransferase AlgX-related protein n=1 Tax=Zhengella sedimenti TaxID=3390035 RepID=UPI003974AAD8
MWTSSTAFRHFLLGGYLLVVALVLAIPAVPLIARLPDFAACQMQMRICPWQDADWRRSLEGFADSAFGLAGDMKDAAAFLRDSGRGGAVVEGVDGWGFYNSGSLRNRHRGRYADVAGAEYWTAIATELHEAQARAGKRFVFMLAPDKHSIYPEFLPANHLADRRGPDTAALVHASLAARGIAYIDSKAVLDAAKATGPLYWKRDTHWNQLGALFIFDRLLEKLDMEPVHGTVDGVYAGTKSIDREGDFATINGEGVSRGEQMPVFRQPLFSMQGIATEALTHADGNAVAGMAPYLIAEGAVADPASKLSIAVIGDSFTFGLFRPLFARHFASVLWLHHQQGGFDRAMIERFDPDVIVLQVVERILE